MKIRISLEIAIIKQAESSLGSSKIHVVTNDSESKF